MFLVLPLAFEDLMSWYFSSSFNTSTQQQLNPEIMIITSAEASQLSSSHLKRFTPVELMQFVMVNIKLPLKHI